MSIVGISVRQQPKRLESVSSVIQTIGGLKIFNCANAS